MAISGSTGVKLFIGGTGALGSEAAWVEVGEIENLGEFGDQSEIVRFLSLSDSRVRKAKGTRDAGDITITFGFDYANTGQVNLKAAADNDTNNAYNFKIELNDEPTGASPKPTTFTFKALVNGFRTNVGAANQTVTVTTVLSITTEVTRVLASPT